MQRARGQRHAATCLDVLEIGDHALAAAFVEQDIEVRHPARYPIAEFSREHPRQQFGELEPIILHAATTADLVASNCRISWAARSDARGRPSAAAASRMAQSLRGSRRNSSTNNMTSLASSASTATFCESRYSVFFASCPGIGLMMIIGSFFTSASAVVMPPGLVIIISAISINSLMFSTNPKILVVWRNLGPLRASRSCSSTFFPVMTII